ncbi:MAG: SMP-30/gluconolactonase/LRE family protein [Blastocatellia bacterium]|nr:SMP-30/gluconolactonase/LRE family protein [Blastocatellia bacterium]
MATKLEILEIYPQVGIPGGEIVITCTGFDVANFTNSHVHFGGVRGRLISASDRRVIAGIPEVHRPGDLEAGVRLCSGDQESNIFPFQIGELLAENLHPVANPAIDLDSGSIYTTISGARGKKVEVSVWVISSTGVAAKYLSDILNPTGLAFDHEGTLFLSSRFDGVVYRVSPFKDVEPFSKELGIATGIAFDRKGRLFVGDRQGTIFVVDSTGHARKFAEIEPSVSAFHLAFHPDGDLFVTGPTTGGSRETVYRINPDGEVSKFFTGLGRPQGLAFDREGNLYVVASLNGHRGIIRISPSGQQAENVLAGNTLIGLAFDEEGHTVLATTQEIYRAPLGVKGYLATN